MRVVTERDLRAPEFAEGTSEDYEFRDDGKIVRKDRWERGIRSIAAMLGRVRGGFEISELVEDVRALVEARDAAEEINFCLLIDALVLSWNTHEPESKALEQRRIDARLALEAAISRITGAPAPLTNEGDTAQGGGE